MGQTLSTPEKLLKLAKSGDYATVRDFLAGVQRHEPDYNRNRSRYLEVQREDGSTPLILAAIRGQVQIVELLLQQGANIQHMNRKGDGGSALHEAVAHKHEAVVDLLLRNGANPLVENVKGFTAMDIACADRNVTLLRRTEQAAVFKGWLMMKVSIFGGLGSEWQRRWCVVCHRYPYPGLPASIQVTHLVFLAYKNTTSTVPSCRVWLDGARASEVFNPKAIARIRVQGPAQLGITLHRKHDTPVGAYYTGGGSEGYMIYLRPDDGSAQSVAALADFGQLVNNRGQRPRPSSTAPAPSQQQYTSPQTPSYSGYPNPSAAGTPGEWPQFQPLSQGGAVHSTIDEEYARRLQMQYDAELAGQLQSSAQMPRPTATPTSATIASSQQQQGGPAYPSAYPSVFGEGYIPSYPGPAQAGAQQTPQPQQQPVQPLASYPSVSLSPESSGHLVPQHSQPSSQPAAAANPAASAQPSDSVPSAPPLMTFDTSPNTAPPQPWWEEGDSRPATSAPSAASAGASATSASAATGAAGSAVSQDDSNVCVICMDEEATAGFLHGDSVHRCVCKGCAAYLREHNTKICPMCRQTASAIINVF